MEINDKKIKKLPKAKSVKAPKDPSILTKISRFSLKKVVESKNQDNHNKHDKPPKKPLNMYQIYFSEWRKRVTLHLREGNNLVTQKEITAEIGERYKNITEKEKQEYQEKVKRDKERFVNQTNFLKKNGYYIDEVTGKKKYPEYSENSVDSIDQSLEKDDESYVNKDEINVIENIITPIPDSENVEITTEAIQNYFSTTDKKKLNKAIIKFFKKTIIKNTYKKKDKTQPIGTCDDINTKDLYKKENGTTDNNTNSSAVGVIICCSVFLFI